MVVKMVQTYAGSDSVLFNGRTYDLPTKQANEFIACGAAVKVATNKDTKITRVEVPDPGDEGRGVTNGSVGATKGTNDGSTGAAS